MLVISWSTFSRIRRFNSSLSPMNWRCGMRMCSFFFLVSAMFLQNCACGFSSFGLERRLTCFFCPVPAFFSFSRSLVELGPCKASHAVCDGDIDFPAPIVYGRIYHLVEHSYPVVCRCISDRFEQMLPAGEQRSIIAGGIRTSRGQPFGFGPRVKTAIDKSTLPEVILKMVFGHSSYHDWHFVAHHTVQPVTFPLYHFRKIFYVHNHQ